MSKAIQRPLQNDEKGRLSQGSPLQSSQMCGNVEQQKITVFVAQRQPFADHSRKVALHIQAFAAAAGEPRSEALWAFAANLARRGANLEVAR